MAFNVERRGVLKLMQGQRRSFGQLDRGGQLGAAAQRSLGCGNVRGSKLPDRRHLEHRFGEEGGVSLDPAIQAEEGEGGVINGRGCLSATASRRDFLTAPLQARWETSPITALFADCPATNSFFRPSGGKKRGREVGSVFRPWYCATRPSPNLDLAPMPRSSRA